MLVSLVGCCEMWMAFSLCCDCFLLSLTASESENQRAKPSARSGGGGGSIAARWLERPDRLKVGTRHARLCGGLASSPPAAKDVFRKFKYLPDLRSQRGVHHSMRRTHIDSRTPCFLRNGGRIYVEKREKQERSPRK